MSIYARIERALIDLLRSRSPSSTICPSDVARSLFDGAPWRQHMDQVRTVVRLLADRGQVRILQRGRPVNPSAAHGPIRIARGPAFPYAPVGNVGPGTADTAGKDSAEDPR